MVGFLCKSAKGVVFWGAGGEGGLAFFVACLFCRLLTLPFRNPQGGLAFFCRLLSLPLVYFPAPIPPTPFPSGEGGDYSYLMQGAPPLASPGLSRKRHGLNLRCRCHGGGRIRAALAVSAASGSFFQKRARAVAPSIINSRKVLGGLGDSFKSPPALSPRQEKPGTERQSRFRATTLFICG